MVAQTRVGPEEFNDFIGPSQSRATSVVGIPINGSPVTGIALRDCLGRWETVPGTIARTGAILVTVTVLEVLEIDIGC